MLHLKAATEAKQAEFKKETLAKKEVANEGVSFLKPVFLLGKK